MLKNALVLLFRISPRGLELPIRGPFTIVWAPSRSHFGQCIHYLVRWTPSIRGHELCFSPRRPFSKPAETIFQRQEHLVNSWPNWSYQLRTMLSSEAARPEI